MCASRRQSVWQRGVENLPRLGFRGFGGRARIRGQGGGYVPVVLPILQWGLPTSFLRAAVSMCALAALEKLKRDVFPPAYTVKLSNRINLSLSEVSI